jgi:hypothetical protein
MNAKRVTNDKYPPQESLLFDEHDIRFKNAVDDADLLIAQTAVDCALSSEVIVIGEDTDLLVLLIHPSINSADGLLPIPKNLDVESQPVNECKKGNK